jgi:hypothetical protein
MKTGNTYATLAARIRAAQDHAALARCEAQYTRHYDAGTIPAAELSRLDVLAMERRAALDGITMAEKIEYSNSFRAPR